MNNKGQGNKSGSPVTTSIRTPRLPESFYEGVAKVRERIQADYPDWDDRLLDALARLTGGQTTLMMAEEARIYKKAAAEFKTAVAALCRAQDTLSVLPQRHGDYEVNSSDLAPPIALLNELEERAMRHVIGLPKAKAQRPANRRLRVAVGTLMARYTHERGQPPANPSYNYATGGYEGDFLEFAMPHLKRWGHGVENEQACARAIPRIMNEIWPGRPRPPRGRRRRP